MLKGTPCMYVHATPIQVEFLNAKRESSIEKLLHLLPPECDSNWTVATCQARQTWQVQQHQQQQQTQSHFRLATSLYFRLSAACSVLPPCAPVPHCVSFYATLFVCLLRVSLFYLDLCSVTGTRWYSEYASQCGKFVSFSPRQIG